ncbi:hypothetical protein ZIOFF_052070 [Zingiber officinale]|uniref:Uncharacterized protein n=1 Tax=Zingiber officinale TaxID=94328 RepID=A0A8J5FTV7_ZINOF|nr:hypothetical protein ZIOFF_052070 [Zingiber officinale]
MRLGLLLLFVLAGKSVTVANAGTMERLGIAGSCVSNGAGMFDAEDPNCNFYFESAFFVSSASSATSALACSSKAQFWLMQTARLGFVDVGRGVEGAAHCRNGYGQLSEGEIEAEEAVVSRTFWGFSFSYIRSRLMVVFMFQCLGMVEAKGDRQLVSAPRISFAAGSCRVIPASCNDKVKNYWRLKRLESNEFYFKVPGLFIGLDWTPERNRIVSASQDGRLIVWNALTSQKTHAIKLQCPWVVTCAFAPNGLSVACGGFDSACSIFNLNSHVERDSIPVSRVLTGHKGYVYSCQYVPDQETRLITSSGDQTCVLWDVTTGQRISVFGGEFPSGHTASVLSVSINSSNSNMFVSGSCDATARLWDARIASRAVQTYHGHQGDVNTVKFFPDGQRFGTGSNDSTCRLYDMRTRHQTGYSSGDCYVWDTLVGEVVLNLGTLQNSHESRISCLGLSSDGSALCTGSWDKNLKIWAFGGDRRVS